MHLSRLARLKLRGARGVSQNCLQKCVKERASANLVAHWSDAIAGLNNGKSRVRLAGIAYAPEAYPGPTAACAMTVPAKISFISTRAHSCASALKHWGLHSMARSTKLDAYLVSARTTINEPR